jgi:acyl-CoA dehydrogenase
MNETLPHESHPATALATAPPRSADLPAIAARIGETVSGPAAWEVDVNGRFPKETFDALAAERMLSVLVPRELGGAGARLSDVALAVEAIGQHCASSAMVYAMHQIQVASLARHGASEWSRQFLSRVAAQELLLASATTEKGIGGDVRTSSCAVDSTDDDRFTLVKDAPVISYGKFADAVLVTARRTPDSPPNDQVLVVVPIEPGTLEQRSQWNALGFRGTCSDGFLLTASGDVSQILSDPYDVISAHTMLPTSHVLWASVWLGLATSAVDTARTYVRADARKNPGSTSAVAVHLAGLVGVLDQFRALVRSATADYEAALNDPEQLTRMGFALRMNSLKVSASTLVVEVVSRALSICGIAGYLEDSPLSLGRRLRDAHGAALMVNNDRILGANAQMLLIHKGER